MKPDHAPATEVSELTSVEKILAWMQAREIPLTYMELIDQDEYSYDLLVPWQSRWIAFSLT